MNFFLQDAETAGEGIDPRFVLDPFEPAYLKLGEAALAARLAWAHESLRECHACPRICGADRMQREEGYCHTGRYARVASAFPHFGEESCLRGVRGSGTIFFSCCNLRCVFCQNADISQQRTGAEYPPDMLSDLMLELQQAGCHNINFVTPEHVAPQTLEAIIAAIPKGLKVPIVYNTSAYDSVDTLRQFDGLVDIYMPDFKFWNSESAALYSQAPAYPECARDAIREMHRQTGVLRFGRDGIARRGVLVRHLVMPGMSAESAAIFDWLAQEISPDTFVNIMAQYRPANHVGRDPRYDGIARRASSKELDAAYDAARRAGLWRFDK